MSAPEPEPGLAPTLAEAPASSAPAPKDDAERLVGQVISGRYRIEALLGKGGMGAVYRVEHTLMRKRLALKVLHAEMGRNPEVVARFEREAMAAAHIDHPNVATATDFGRMDDGAFFLILEYVEGTSLGAALKSGPMAPERAVFIARQIASAMVRAHELGIIHRDLKPDNVMLVERAGDRDIVKVLDFGIAKLSDGVFAASGSSPGSGAALTRAGTIYGTPEYMAPEQALGEVVDARSDLYALGALTYEMLTGALPFDGGDITKLLGQIITSPVPPMAQRAPSHPVPPAIEAVVMRLLEKQAANRYPAARDVVAALDEAAALSGFGPASRATRTSAVAFRASATDETAGPVSLRLPRVNLPPRAWMAGAAGLVVLVAVAIFFAWGGSKPDGVATASEPRGIVEQLVQRKGLSEDDLRDAVEKGPEALEKLAGDYPEDPRVPRALVKKYTEAKRPTDALRAVGKVVALDGTAASDPELLATVTGAASAGPDAADAAFALLEGPLGERGFDALYDFASRTSGSPTRTRALQSIAKPAVRAHASPAALVAADLRAAQGCEARRALLTRAQQHGDTRALALLKPLTAIRGCGFLNLGDCYKCLRGDTALRDAIAGIEARGR